MSRHVSSKILVGIAALVVFCFAGLAAPPGVLPVHIEENHGGSFGWFASISELDEPCTLILVDAHSDASAADHSDEIREGLRRVVNPQEREQRIAQWWADGRIQAYNWIEPLMPRPIERVVWVARNSLTDPERSRLQAEAQEAVDGRTEFEARQSGDLAGRWSVADLEELEKRPAFDCPILATIDLDYFSGMSDAAEQFQRVWKRLMLEPRLRGVSLAISRAWLKDDAEAFKLLQIALQEIRLTRGAVLSFEPFAPIGPDDSRRAAELAAAGNAVPRLEIERAPADMKDFLLLNSLGFQVRFETERWRKLLETWRTQTEHWRIEMPQSIDGILHVETRHLPTLRVRCSGPNSAGRVRWWALRSEANCYNLFPDFGPGKGFAQAAVPWVRDSRILICETSDGVLSPDRLRAELDPTTGWGRIRIEAEVEVAQGWKPTSPVEIRAGEGTGFRRGLSEQFGLPYVFGIGFAQGTENDGADVGWGNDCANFLISAWRSSGRPLPWCNPAQLREKLETLNARALAHDNSVRITGAEIKRGLVIDLGNHVAAVWEDVAPIGILSAEDVVLHHLGGAPAKTTLAELSRDRPFSVRVMSENAACKLLIGGDIVMAGVAENEIPSGSNEHAVADLVVANLEGVPTDREGRVKSFDFSFPADRLQWLKKMGVAAVSLANNHANDSGLDAIRAAPDLLSAAGIGSFGAGANEEAALRPWNVECKGVKLAFFGVSVFPGFAATALNPGVVELGFHWDQLRQKITLAKLEGRTVIVLAHWGREFSQELESEQVAWSKWLLEQGADAVVGSHPHVVQPLQFWRGKPIAFSLGNAVYPNELKGADSAGWLEISMDSKGRIVHSELLQ